MRLKPAVTVEEALTWLKGEAVSTWGVEMTPEVEKMLVPTAEAMAAVSAAIIPDEAEPLLV
jgi:hypothetical protein